MHQLDDKLADVLNVYRSSLHRFIIVFTLHVTLNYVDRESIFITYNNLSLFCSTNFREIFGIAFNREEGVARFRARVAWDKKCLFRWSNDRRIECGNSGKKLLHERYLARNSGNGAVGSERGERKLFPKGSLILNASINRAINHFESHQHPARHVKTRSTSHSIEAILSLVFELNGRRLLSSSRFNTFERGRQSPSNI